MKKKQVSGIILMLAVFLLLESCRSTINFSAPLSGKFNQVRLPEKNFIIIGPVFASSTEIHTVKSLGNVIKVEGRKITHNDLVIKAAELGADDIINVTIDMKTSGRSRYVNRSTGWERVFTYTGSALAIKYIDDEKVIEEDILLENLTAESLQIPLP